MILCGSSSILAESFYARCSHRYNIVNISRSNSNKNLIPDCIEFDFSSEFNREVLDDLLWSIRSRMVDSSEVVLCLFAWAGTPRTSSDPAKKTIIEGYNNNIVRNFSLLAQSLCPSHICFLSSAGGLYDGTLNTIYNESSLPLPASPYGKQKLMAESLMSSLAINLSSTLCTFRICCAYGLNLKFPDQGVLNKWLFDGLKRGEINIYNNLSSTLNFISFEQISVAIELSVDSSLDGIYNLGSCRSTSLSCVYKSVQELIPTVRSNYIDNSLRYLNVDCTKFQQATGLSFESDVCRDAPYIYSKIKDICSF